MAKLASLCAEDMVVKMGGTMPVSGIYNGFVAWAEGQLSKMHSLFSNFNLEIVNMFEDSGNVFTVLKMTGDILEALNYHYAVIKNEKYSEFFMFDDTQKMAQAIKTV